jgi:hypothetical protein
VDVIAYAIDFIKYGVSLNDYSSNVAIQLLTMLFINCGLPLNGGKHNVIDDVAVIAHRNGFNVADKGVRE